MLGNGDGTFGGIISYPTLGSIGQLAPGDFDGDGRLDLALADDYHECEVWILLGNGDGTFEVEGEYGTGKGSPSLAIADLNEDGRPDLAVANAEAESLIEPTRLVHLGRVSLMMNLGRTPASVATGFEFAPNTLNLASRGRWVTGYLEPTAPLAAGDVDASSIRLNGTVPVDPAAPTALGDHDGDGVPDLMVKFDRAAVELTVSDGDSVSVTVTGTLDGQPFSGTDFIRVRRGRISAPSAGGHLSASSVAQVRWEIPGGVMLQSVALLFSPDGGGTWSNVAHGLANTGSYDWTVPNVPTDRAKVAVLVESADGTGVVDAVLGVSETFSIGAAVGVGDAAPGRLALAIRAAMPNPAVGGRLSVEFTLRDGSPAKLELLDVAGRALASKQVGSFGPGRHSIDLSNGRALSPGIYFLRLTQGGSEVKARAAVLR
jgi:hypothetical protein